MWLTAAALRAELDDAATALGSVLDPDQRPVADRLAELGQRVLVPTPVR